MASSSSTSNIQFSLFILLITLTSSLHIHARDSQFYNKASIPTFDADQPKFLPESDNSYGLYPHDSSQLPSAAENHNPVAYVTLPENNNYNYFYSRPQPQGMSDTRFMESGKYFYDLNTHKFSTNHPYQILPQDPTTNQFYNNNFYGNTESRTNAYEFDGEGYQTQDDVNNLP